LKLSFIIPAFNEEKLLPTCLRSVDEAVSALACHTFAAASVPASTPLADISVEIIVADNNSTDATAHVAEAAGAKVVFEAVNQISRARNTGALAASGDWLIFIDADCELSPALLIDVVELIQTDKYVGFGSTVAMPDLPRWANFILWLWTRISLACNLAAGSFVACRAEDFRAIGGFSNTLYAAEEIDFSRRLKTQGQRTGRKFKILRQNPLLTSNRKLMLYSRSELFSQLGRLILRPRRATRSRRRLGVWYDGRR
jgi:glycosyltransferase involved in cell wall biosynthesis